jgi:hypothetical protein
MPQRQRECVQRGLEALRRYVDCSESIGFDHLSTADLLLFRSAQSLMYRLDADLAMNMRAGASHLSAADIWALKDLADSTPEDRETFIDFGMELARIVYVPGISPQPTHRF